MQAVQLKTQILSATHFVQMDQDERPPVDEVIEFARQNGASHHNPEGVEMFLVHLCDENQFWGMNYYTLNAGLTIQLDD